MSHVATSVLTKIQLWLDFEIYRNSLCGEAYEHHSKLVDASRGTVNAWSKLYASTFTWTWSRKGASPPNYPDAYSQTQRTPVYNRKEKENHSLNPTHWNNETVRLFGVRWPDFGNYFSGVRRSMWRFAWVFFQQFDIRSEIFDVFVSSSTFELFLFWKYTIVSSCRDLRAATQIERYFFLFSVTFWTMIGRCEAPILVKSVTQQFSTSDGSGIVSDEALELELWTFLKYIL